jgi:hypothetical protein
MPHERDRKLHRQSQRANPGKHFVVWGPAMLCQAADPPCQGDGTICRLDCNMAWGLGSTGITKDQGCLPNQLLTAPECAARQCTVLVLVWQLIALSAGRAVQWHHCGATTRARAGA